MWKNNVLLEEYISHTDILTEGDNEGYNVLWIYINLHLLCYCIDLFLNILLFKFCYM